MYKFLYEYFSICLDIYLEEEFLGNSMFNFLRNWQNVFQSSCTISYPHYQSMRGSISLHLCQHLLLFIFFIKAILLGDTTLWFWFEFLYWLMMLDIFSCCILAICSSSLKNVYLNSLTSFNWVIRVFIVELQDFFIYTRF